MLIQRFTVRISVKTVCFLFNISTKRQWLNCIPYYWSQTQKFLALSKKLVIICFDRPSLILLLRSYYCEKKAIGDHAVARFSIIAIRSAVIIFVAILKASCDAHFRSMDMCVAVGRRTAGASLSTATVLKY